jgi:hypothetical protein
MSTKKSTKSDELLTSADVELQDNPSYPLVDVEKIEGTPFHVVSDENGHIVAIGKYRLSEILENKEDAIELIDSKNWNLIMNLIALITNFEINEKNKITETTNEN